jgi:hypothetical protein
MTLPNPADAFGVLLRVAASEPRVAAFEFATIDFAPLLNDRGPLNPSDTVVIDRALQLREQLRLPFWDGVMLESSRAEMRPACVLKAATFHQSLEGKVECVSVDKLDIIELESLSQTAQSQNKLLAVTSMVRMRDGSERHMPLLDFHTAYSERGTALIAEIIPLLGISGALLKSGKSYHFYGDSLLTSQELTVFLGKALLFAPIVDRAWIAHQLIECRCALRISPRTEYGGVPLFLRYVG